MNEKARLLDRLIQNRTLSHFLFWIGTLAIFTMVAALSSGSFTVSLISYLALVPIWLMAGYFLVYYQVPKLLLNRKYGRFALSFAFSLYGFSVLARLSNIYIAEPFYRENFYQENLLEVLSDPLHLAVVYFPSVYVVVFLMLVIKVVKDRFEEKHRLEVVQSEKANTELKFLKAQIHPHFLFNTLNNLYALTLTKSDQAPEVVLKLSEMLDYMLYQCNEPTVLIRKEIDLLQGYIDLESLRYGEKLDLSFSHSCDEIDSKIAPLILLSFVENAFKHGASSDAVSPKIEIDLKVKDGDLNFRVFNSKPIQQEKKEKGNSGIGFTNAKRQLELSYKNQYDLSINESSTEYEVKLNINLG